MPAVRNERYSFLQGITPFCSRAFPLRDRLFLLFPPTNISNRSIDSLFSQGYECPQNYNPADFLIAIVAPDSDAENARERTRNVCDLFLTTEASNEIHQDLKEEMQSYHPSNVSTGLSVFGVNSSFLLIILGHDHVSYPREERCVSILSWPSPDVRFNPKVTFLFWLSPCP